jgi:DNA-directed RNA polymerase specialized sigma24 family protein
MCLTNDKEGVVPATDLAAYRIRILYTDHHGWLYGWLRRKLGNVCDVADLAHDTFYVLWVHGRYQYI